MNNIKAAYNIYKKYYRAQEDSAIRRGSYMAEGMLSRKAYIERYMTYREDFKSDVEEGLRKNIGNINRQIARDQTYFAAGDFRASHKYAKNIRYFLKQENEKLLKENPNIDKSLLYDTNYMRIRHGEVEIHFEIIEEYRNELAARGYSKQEIAKEVGRHFFGSPK